MWLIHNLVWKIFHSHGSINIPHIMSIFNALGFKKIIPWIFPLFFLIRSFKVRFFKASPLNQVLNRDQRSWLTMSQCWADGTWLKEVMDGIFEGPQCFHQDWSREKRCYWAQIVPRFFFFSFFFIFASYSYPPILEFSIPCTSTYLQWIHLSLVHFCLSYGYS